jgi:high-affinity nickel-transport protein
VIELLESTAFGAALIFGFRHGFDWDHLAALTDLTGSQSTARRSMGLATLYALGHAVMVLVLGAAAILLADRLPDSVDLVMERFVGVSLIALGVWMAWTAVTTRGAPPPRSRWMLLIEAVQRVVGRRRPTAEPIVIEHSHPHDHAGPMHEHSHDPTELVHSGHQAAGTEVAVQHRHLHRHVAVAPADPFMRYSSWSSFGIGLLHGVGAETPTQVLVFAAAAQASGRPTSIGRLVASNTLVAAASTLGVRRVLGHRAVAMGLAAVTAGFSLVVGALLLLGEGSVLPPILGG